MALFPPIVASSMPAFNIEDGSVKIYFTLPDYTSSKRDDIAAVHVSVKRQSSNVNVLNNDNEIIQKQLQQTEEDKVLNRYFITLLDSDIIHETTNKTKHNFEVDVLYKVQLRFSSIYFDDKTIGSQFNSFADLYTNGIQYFSEWSTVCIIKPIIAPIFYLEDFHTENSKEENLVDDQHYSFYSELADFVGVYKPNGSSEKLKSWRLRLLSEGYTKDQNIDNYLLKDSGWIPVSAYNYNLNSSSLSLECSLSYAFEEAQQYNALFEIKTINDYVGSKLYNFDFEKIELQALVNYGLTAAVNEEEGYIKLVATNYGATQTIDNLVIRRSDSKGDFLNWQDLKNFEAKGHSSWTYYDFTAESGIAYRYLIQKRDPRGRRGTPLYHQGSGSSKYPVNAIIPEWEHAFLLQSNKGAVLDTLNYSNMEMGLSDVKQLKLKYDFQISSYKTNVSESKIDTIGNKYPFIRRNGNMYYRSFPCSGTITFYMDNVDLFTNYSKMFGSYSNLENMYSSLHGLNSEYGSTYNHQYDETYERKFREQVEKFLYNSKPKLYKSMQEGNILIKLMEVSLTPKTELNRLIYTFSATAYEIDQPSLKNLNYYGIIDTGTFNPDVNYEKDTLGQVTSYLSEDQPIGNIFQGGKDIIGADSSTAAANSIAKKEKYQIPLYNQNYQYLTDFKLTYLRLTIESSPYLIVEDSTGHFRPYDDIDNENDDFKLGIEGVQGKKNKTKDDNSFTDDIDFVTPEEKNHKNKLYQLEAGYIRGQTLNKGQDLNIYLGHLFTINGKQIIVSYPNNIYEFKEDNLFLPKTTTIVPAKDTIMTIDYTIEKMFITDPNIVPKLIQTETKVGQLIGRYNSGYNFIKDINNKYYTRYEQNNSLIKQYVDNIKSLAVDTEPGALFRIKTQSSSQENISEEWHQVIINETGQFLFDPQETSVSITNFELVGIVFNINIVDAIGLKEYQEGEPLFNKCYKIENNEYKVYLNSTWYDAQPYDQSNPVSALIVYCPVDVILYYTIKVRSDFY